MLARRTSAGLIRGNAAPQPYEPARV